MKSVAKLLTFVLTICLIGGSATIVSAQETSANTSSNVQSPISTVNTDIKMYPYTLMVGDIKDVTLKSAKYYSVKGKDVVNVTKSGKTLNIEAVAEGEATITLKDSKKKVIARILITVEEDELIEDTEDSEDTDAGTSVSQTAQPTIIPSPAENNPTQTTEQSNQPIQEHTQNTEPTQVPVQNALPTSIPVSEVQPTRAPEQNAQPTSAPVQHDEGANRPIYNGVVSLSVGVNSAFSQMQSSENNETISLTMSDGYIAAVSNGETVSAMIANNTLYIMLKKKADPYVIVADAQGKAIYRIHVLPVQ